MLLSLIPITFVLPFIGPSVDSKAMFFVVFVLALVLATIVPNINAHAFHIIV
jgi:hypothetical protein